MKRLAVISTLILLLIVSAKLYPMVARSAGTATVSQSVMEPTDSKHIIESTIHVIFYPKRNHQAAGALTDSQQDEAIREVIIERARGIGTVVITMGHVLIVTHDHWEWAPEELDHVELRDTKDTLILEMSGEAFQSIVRYRDGGTMILTAPGILLSAGIVPASLSTSDSIQPGSIVQVAYRSGEDRRQMDVLSALVESIGDREGRLVLNLRSLDGQPVIRGDSGGGVWIDGQLTGNLWKAVTVESVVQETRIWGSKEVVVTTEDSSIAARFPLDAQALEMMLADGALAESGSEY